MGGARSRRLGFALAAATFAAAATASAEPKLAESGARSLAPAIAFDEWAGLASGCSYLAPRDGFVAADGGVDVVFHFHAGQMSTREMKESGANAVFVSCGFGMGTTPYARAFADPRRFDRMTRDLVRKLAAKTGRQDVHLRHVALASWSAGFASVARILSVERYYAMVDTVVLLDSLHAPYLAPNPHTPAQGKERVDVRALRVFVRFAKDAAHGDKTMIVTHSSIVPPDYASTGEATGALLDAIGVPTRGVDETNERGMRASDRADAGGLHVRGFRGRGPHDHFDHLHLIGDVMQRWVVPRWKRPDRLVYTLAGEQR